MARVVGIGGTDLEPRLRFQSPKCQELRSCLISKAL